MIRENKQQKVYRILKGRIIEREYVPGQRIVIDQIAKELATSSIPVREAIRQLEAERLVVYKRNIGPVVAEVNESDYLDTVHVLARLEGYAAGLAAKSFPKEKLKLLRELNISMEEALEDFDIIQFSKLNATFHRIICEQCDNNYLLETIQNTWNRIDSIRGTGSTLYSKRVKESIQEHKEIIALLESGDSEQVEILARDHKIKTAENFEKRRKNLIETNSLFM
ncbi:MAG TPA: GntR family transcriptional regulator [Ornithinibacillus sp.]|uniref:GntR family transcriptional regulator n=2 Tax=Ornithinibacillus bavariensis TaxID=545502 RepID=A0A919X5Z6_9BACI|nr:GntR family transcriptional regulator [Ornithinibacillus bavariensis]HAM80179.1 GntR family transcriptional regulator [Ornithinibacillus sp.]